jgi:hypothetical protein
MLKRSATLTTSRVWNIGMSVPHHQFVEHIISMRDVRSMHEKEHMFYVNDV